MSRTVPLLLDDILERIRRIERSIGTMEHAAFLGDEKTIDSVVRNLEVIGEAAGRLPDEFRERFAAIPWRRIVGLRNRIVHAYFDVDLDLVWAIVREELPDLRDRLLAIRREGAGTERGSME